MAVCLVYAFVSCCCLFKCCPWISLTIISIKEQVHFIIFMTELLLLVKYLIPSYNLDLDLFFLLVSVSMLVSNFFCWKGFVYDLEVKTQIHQRCISGDLRRPVVLVVVKKNWAQWKKQRELHPPLSPDLVEILPLHLYSCQEKMLMTPQDVTHVNKQMVMWLKVW